MNTEWKIKLTWEGFARINLANIVDFLSQNGYSKTEVRRLLKDNAIKISDIKVTEDGNHFVWYKRPVAEKESIETGDILFVGKHHSIMFRAIPFAWYELIYYRVRDRIDRLKDIKVREHYLFSKV